MDVKTDPAWHLYVIQAKERDKLSEYLNKNGIATGIHYPIALPYLKAYQYLGHKRDDFPVASSLENTILSLPIFPVISKEQLDYVILKIKAFNLNS